MRAIGGNSGYVGYSQSVRAYNAKQEHIYTLTLIIKTK